MTEPRLDNNTRTVTMREEVDQVETLTIETIRQAMDALRQQHTPEPTGYPNLPEDVERALLALDAEYGPIVMRNVTMPRLVEQLQHEVDEVEQEYRLIARQRRLLAEIIAVTRRATWEHHAWQTPDWRAPRPTVNIRPGEITIGQAVRGVFLDEFDARPPQPRDAIRANWR